MIEKEKAQNNDKTTKQSYPESQYYNKKIEEDLVLRIDFNPNSKDTFQEKLLNVVQAERKE